MIVIGEGSLTAKIALIGEAPGKEEDKLGRPFVGGSGRILDAFLYKVGIDRFNCYLDNVMQTRPPDNNFDVFYTDKRKRKVPTPELIEGRKRLINTLSNIKPNVTVALGNEALRALTKCDVIGKWRGSILYNENIGKVIPTFHPAAVMKNWEFAPLLAFDLRRAKEESANFNYKIPERHIIIEPTFEKVMEFLDKILEDKYGHITFDIETSGEYITAFGISTSPTEAISIPFYKGNEPYWSAEALELIWFKIAKVMESEVPKYAQNAQFDCSFLKKYYGITVKNLVFDTMCGHTTVYAEIPKGLDTLCSIYTRQPYYKHWRTSGSDKVFFTYNAMDACITHECAEKIIQEMEESDLLGFYYMTVHSLLTPLMEIQLRGVRVDLEERDKAVADITPKIDLMQSKLNELVGHEVNVMSPKQLSILFYQDLKLPVKTHRRTGRITTDEDAIEELAKKHASPIFDLILGIRENKKLLSTYLKARLDEGRMHTSYIAGGTETGRLASRQSFLGTGTNLQNVPKGICREMFIPDEGKVFLNADLSQAEARVVAWLANEEALIKIFMDGGDVHREVAAWIFSKDAKQVTSYEREKAKRTVHAANYGIGPRKFASVVGCEYNEAVSLINRYFQVFPNIKMLQNRVVVGLKTSRTMTTPLGRKRIFFGRWGDELFREAYAFVPQSTVGELANIGMVKVWSEVRARKLDAQIMLLVHDNIVIQCRPESVEEMKSILKECMEIPIIINGRSLTIPIGIKEGGNWDECS